MTGETHPVQLAAGAVTDAATRPLAHEPVPDDQVVAGTPTTAYAELDVAADGGRELGVWEMTPGAMRDTEADEVFLVIAGRATVEFVDPALPAIELGPGSLMRLEAGMRTVWTVHETLRKLYVAP
ncbi:cupin domain-containing protein [Agromyces sp. NPDC056523]|uniref:cupin domain-containing protein n=1 Tax=Agromyces sp. NPDC056523 TaxID=3345850 RepID=UPI00366B0B2C